MVIRTEGTAYQAFGPTFEVEFRDALVCTASVQQNGSPRLEVRFRVDNNSALHYFEIIVVLVRHLPLLLTCWAPCTFCLSFVRGIAEKCSSRKSVHLSRTCYWAWLQNERWNGATSHSHLCRILAPMNTCNLLNLKL